MNLRIICMRNIQSNYSNGFVVNHFIFGGWKHNNDCTKMNECNKMWVLSTVIVIHCIYIYYQSIYLYTNNRSTWLIYHQLYVTILSIRCYYNYTILYQLLSHEHDLFNRIRIFRIMTFVHLKGVNDTNKGVSYVE